MPSNYTFTTFRDYSQYHHVLGAGIGCVHPINGNIYYWACEQLSGARQNLVIYREMGRTLEWQHVVTFAGTVDAKSFVERGGCWIGQGGALLVATSLQPLGVEYDVERQTGFKAVKVRIPKIDDPWSLMDSAEIVRRFNDVNARLQLAESRLAALESRIVTAPAPQLDPGDREALNRLRAMIGI